MKSLLYFAFTIVLSCSLQAQTTSNAKLPLQVSGTTATAGSQSDTSVSNRGVNGAFLRLDYFLGRWFSFTAPNDTLRNIRLMVLNDSIGVKEKYLSNGRVSSSLSGSSYRPSFTMDLYDSGYSVTNLITFRVLSNGGSRTLAQIGVGGDGEGFISGRRQGDSTATFQRFFAAWNDSVLGYVNGSEVFRLDPNQSRFKRDVVLDSSGNLVAPKLKFKIIDVSGGNAVDSVSIGISAGALGVRAIEMSNPIKLPSTASNTLSGKSSLLTSSGDTLIWKDGSAVINRIKLSGASAGQSLTYNGSSWVPTTISGGGGGSGNGIRFKLSDGSVNIYPDTTVTATVRNFILTNGVGEEGVLNTIQNIDSTAAFKVRTLTADSAGGSGGAVLIKNGTGKVSRLVHAAGSNTDTVTIPNTTGTLALLAGGQTFTSAIWNGTAIGKAYETLMSGKDIQDSINARAAGDTMIVPIYFTGGFSSYNAGFASSLRIGRGATTTTQATAVGDGATAGGTTSIALGFGSSSNGNNSIAVGGNSSAGGTSAAALGASAVASGNSTVALGNLASATATGASALGNGAAASGVSSVALGRGSSATHDSSIAFNTSSSGVHHIDTRSADTLILPSGKIKANGTIVRIDFVTDSMFVRSGLLRVAKYVPGLTGASWISGSLADSRPAIVSLTGHKVYAKTDSIIIEAYQTFDLDNAKFNVWYIK